MSPFWSYALAAVGILGIYLAGRRSWVGWAVGVGAQALWIVYAIATSQPGFIVSAVAFRRRLWAQLVALDSRADPTRGDLMTAVDWVLVVAAVLFVVYQVRRPMRRP